MYTTGSLYQIDTLTNTMRSNISTAEKLIMTLGIGVVFAVIIVMQASNTVKVSADGNGTPAACETTINISGNANNLSYTDPNGNPIDGVCIKSGNNMFGANKHSDPLTNGTYENGCYTVTGVGTSTVTVIRNFDSNTCQGLSHVDVIVGSPTATPSATPSESPSSTPSATPSSDPSESPRQSNDPTPTPSATATPTSAPTDSGSNTGGGSSSSSNSSSGEVLGASTITSYADTGIVDQIIANIVGAFGVISTTASVLISRKSKKA